MLSQLLSILSWYNVYLDTHPILTKALLTAVIGIVGDAMAQYHEHRLIAKKASSTSLLSSGSDGCKDDSSTVTTYVLLDSEDTDSNDSLSNSGRSITATRTTITATRPVVHFHYDIQRGISNMMNNICITTPLYHFGYDFLDTIIPISSSSSINALLQVLIDCIVFDATFVFLLYISSGTIENYMRVAPIDIEQVVDDEDNDSSHVRQHQLEVLSTVSLKNKLLPAILASWKMSMVTAPIEYILFRYFPLRLRVLGMNLIDLLWDGVISFMLHGCMREIEFLTPPLCICKYKPNGSKKVSLLLLFVALVPIHYAIQRQDPRLLS